MNILSLFDGISCGQLALQRAEKKVDKYYASEIDKHARKIAVKNFPNTIELGDVRGVDVSKLDKIDLLIGGSPCQSFSIAGDGSGFDGKSGLFFEYLRVLKEAQAINPNLLFLLENVKMKKEWQNKISELLGVEPIEINSTLVSAQNRRRLYWTNIPGITQPKDRGIVLKDILESGVVDRQKDFCLDASYFKGGNIDHYFGKSRRKLVFQINPDKSARGVQPHMQDRVYYLNGKTVTLSAAFASRTKVGDFLEDKIAYRNLTVVECERLQTLPDGYTSGVSDAQRYKAIGNGWTVDVISHIFSFIP
jgi:site-specific DNA-cytosine methylase